MSSTRRIALTGGLLALADAGCWIVATIASALARYDFHLDSVQWGRILAYAALAATVHVVVGSLWHLYQGRHPRASLESLVTLSAVAAIPSVVVGVAFLAVPGAPHGLVVIVPAGAFVLLVAVRSWSILRAATNRPAGADDQRILVYGAGNAAEQVAPLLGEAGYHVVGFIDDDPTRRHRMIRGRRVLGPGHRLREIATEHGVDTVLLAMPSVPNEVRRSITDAATAAGLRTLTLPPMRDIVGGEVRASQIHEVNVLELLGRQEVETRTDQIADQLTGKVVLITGAGGSIGSEIARQVHRFGPRELILLDRDESALHAVQLSLYGRALLDTPDMVLCDIRDAEAVTEAFARHRPEVVFHAAALKHLPMLEQYPAEGHKTNVLGTLNVLRAAADVDVAHFVNVSTDKAADPSCVLGRTKRTAEQLTSWFAHTAGGSYVSVRFGNVLGSRGSMLHTFTQQIARGGPVTVTHPEVTRYFMTIPEAAELTLQAAALGDEHCSGSVFVLDMGTPVRILDVAERLVRESRTDCSITFTGLRPGEKMHEVLLSGSEEARATAHPLITRVDVEPLTPALAEGRRNPRTSDLLDDITDTGPRRAEIAL